MIHYCYLNCNISFVQVLLYTSIQTCLYRSQDKCHTAVSYYLCCGVSVVAFGSMIERRPAAIDRSRALPPVALAKRPGRQRAVITRVLFGLWVPMLALLTCSRILIVYYMCRYHSAIAGNCDRSRALSSFAWHEGATLKSHTTKKAMYDVRTNATWV